MSLHERMQKFANKKVTTIKSDDEKEEVEENFNFKEAEDTGTKVKTIKQREIELCKGKFNID